MTYGETRGLVATHMGGVEFEIESRKKALRARLQSATHMGGVS